MSDHGRRARIVDKPGDAIDDADPSIGQSQQGHSAIGGNPPAVEGRADFLAHHAWQIEQKTGIVIHGGRGAFLLWDCVGVSNQNLFQISLLRYSRQPMFSSSVNKTG